MDQPGALRAVDALQEQRALQAQALVEGAVQRGFDRVHDLQRREQGAAFCGNVGARGVERGTARITIGQALRVARSAHRRAGREQLLRVGQAFGQRVVAAAQSVHQAERECFLRADMATDQHQLECGCSADQARRALRAAGARHQAELHLGQAELGAVHRQPVVRCQRHLQPTPERRAVQRGDHRLAAGLDAVAHVGQRRRLRRLAELADVCTGDEVAAGADEQHRGDGVVRLGRVDCSH